ncbi:MAG: hypothetical protein ABIO60_01710 [Aquaticitalea sp.]
MNVLLIMDQDYTGVIFVVLGIMFGLPLILAIIGLRNRKKNPKASKVLFIVAGVYLLISLGICGSMMM